MTLNLSEKFGLIRKIKHIDMATGRLTHSILANTLLQDEVKLQATMTHGLIVECILA